MTDTAVAGYAEAYARDLGWAVIPIWWIRDDGACACGQPGCRNAGKHPITALAPSGLGDASSDPDVVRSWWDAYPRANVAVACEASRLVVLDVDPRNGGDETLEFVERSVCDLPYTLTASTGGGGRHLFYAATVGLRARGRVGRGVDVKHRGYVLLPPSNHASGGVYAWITEGVQPQPLTPETLELVSAGGTYGANGSGGNGADTARLTATGEYAPLDISPLIDGTLGTGERHEFFKSYVGSLRARRWRREEAKTWIESRWEDVDQSEHPFPLDEALALLDWVYDNRPEGTPQERALEGYREWIETYGTPNLALAEAGTVVDDATTAHDVNAEIQALPDALREAVLGELLRESAREYVRGVRARAEFVAPAARLSLRDELALPDPPLPWTVERLWVAGSNVTLVAMYKTGKTVFHLNLARALVDNEPFLGAFQTRPLAGRVGIVNAELDEALWRDWARRIGMRNLDRASVLHLRGYRVDVATDVGREWLAAWCREREIEVLLLDPLARLQYGDENSASDIKRWTDSVDVLKREAGVIDAHVAVHAGRISERLEEGELPRARGSSRIDDWPDALWMLLREGREVDAPRYLAVEGRRVSLEETELAYDVETLRLELVHVGGTSRRNARDLRGVERVVGILTERGATSFESGLTSTALRSAIGGQSSDADQAIARAITLGRVRVQTGAGRARVHWAVGEDSIGPMVWPAGGVEV